ncbi:MAG: class I SAM-dependent methyltransferase [Oscillatoriaceae cyanobacterium]
MTNDIFGKKQEFFDAWAPFYDCPLTAIFYLAVHQRMLEYAKLPENAKVLDIGCGTGRLLRRLAAENRTLQGVGLDLSPQMLAEARVNNRYADRLMFREGNGESLPFDNPQFDAVFNTISFLHYPHPAKMLAEVARVLQPGGYFYLADTTVREEQGDFHWNFSPSGVRFYSPRRREELGREAGLAVVQHYYLLGPVLLTVFTKSSGELLRG